MPRMMSSTRTPAADAFCRRSMILRSVIAFIFIRINEGCPRFAFSISRSIRERTVRFQGMRRNEQMRVISLQITDGHVLKEVDSINADVHAVQSG